MIPRLGRCWTSRILAENDPNSSEPREDRLRTRHSAVARVGFHRESCQGQSRRGLELAPTGELRELSIVPKTRLDRHHVRILSTRQILGCGPKFNILYNIYVSTHRDSPVPAVQSASSSATVHKRAPSIAHICVALSRVASWTHPPADLKFDSAQTLQPLRLWYLSFTKMSEQPHAVKYIFILYL
jgi:hypothetical protein